MAEFTDKKKAASDSISTATVNNGASSAEVAQLAAGMAGGDTETARTAKRALWRIVRHAGRSGAEQEQRALAGQLVALLKPDVSAVVGREVLWMLSEIGTGDTVESIVAMLKVKGIREDARMSLERIPGPESLAALRSALDRVPDDFKMNIVQSLRARGESIAGFPCEKLKPTKRTRVKVE